MELFRQCGGFCFPFYLNKYQLYHGVLVTETGLLEEITTPSGLTKPDEVGDFFALVSMKSSNFCQKVKF
jgi:hypothetical protein